MANQLWLCECRVACPRARLTKCNFNDVTSY